MIVTQIERLPALKCDIVTDSSHSLFQYSMMKVYVTNSPNADASYSFSGMSVVIQREKAHCFTESVKRRHDEAK